MEKSENAVVMPPPSTGPYPQAQNPPYMPQAYSQPYPQANPQQHQPTVQLQSTANVVTIQTMSIPGNERNAHYNSKGSKRTGYLHIGIGILCILLGVVAIVVECSLANGGTPIWSGLLFFLVTGLLGVHAGKTKGTCAIVGYMVMCIISAIMAFNAFTVVLVAACSEERMQCNWEYGPRDILVSDYDVDYEHKYVCRNRAGIGGCIAVNAILTILCLTEMIVCIIASALCCRGVCCRPSPARNQSVVYQPQQMIIAAPGQPMPHGNVVIQQYTVAAPQPSAPPQYGEPVPSTGQMYAVPQGRPPAYTPVYSQVVEQSTPGAAV